MTKQKQFVWECHPKAEAFLKQTLKECAEKNSEIATLQKELAEQTSTRLFDWIDHFAITETAELQQQLKTLGFAPANDILWHHPQAQLPKIALIEEKTPGIAVSVESIANFLMVRGQERVIEGSPLSPYRRCCFAQEKGVALSIVERRSTWSLNPKIKQKSFSHIYLEAKELWQSRSRTEESEDDELSLAIVIAQELVNRLGKEMAAWIVLEVEREYWQQRNFAGQIQKARQDSLGMGWANHDHHTFRSSRAHFTELVRLFETLGFHCRERFYAGEEAGWGAQVMESPYTGLVLFLDVDLQPEEVAIDFAHQHLDETDELGTIGLWCALHGDSILKAGMHHLEAQFSFDQLTEDLEKWGIKMMDPFSHFPHLKQAFTVAETWYPSKQRIEALLKEKKISEKQAKEFLEKGAVGSHLENLQRHEGYKGFNQSNISYIIRETDPRKSVN